MFTVCCHEFTSLRNLTLVMFMSALQLSQAEIPRNVFGTRIRQT
uniref:Uncharacterized protein n=1 Tax=Arundo donax TaxID=35708 RepID=A0A0A9BJ53_ARUDO